MNRHLRPARSGLPRRARRRHSAARGGFTLVEMLAVVAVLGVLASLVGGAWSHERRPAPADGDPSGVAAARRAAVLRGVPVTAVVILDRTEVTVTALPDGRVLGPPSSNLDPLSGRDVRSGGSP